ncbi:OLC1v1010161C1 [Oldenlandia corymbosa var. corymbosa]|uniref:OLC1v1010161C1 n=1 Tax=Oldenlandia corymbosa var. corymbosa TaxID=529605 RepID=A0AAV1DT32_OLDCO|nr:OLC1v1010161C1 [Oldenlandia corymbosa var. corymbosa]
MEWVRGEILGHGSFASVSLAKPTSQSGGNSPMAVKSCSASNPASLINEKSILDEFKDCPDIIQCYGDSYSFEHGEKLYNLFLEYASGGALANKVKSSCDQRLPECEVRRYAKGILRGLNCIHKSGYVHCDIKLQNILLTQEGEVKIADFGLAKKVSNGKGKKLGCELRGTPLYMSPEMVAGGDQSSPADIWALGCVVAEMVTGIPAWGSSNDLAGLLMRIGVGEQVPEVPGNLSEEGKDFLRKCFVKDPQLRWTAEMLLNHPFVSSSSEFDHRHSHATVTFDNVRCWPSPSPRSAFDFPDWVSQQSSSSTFSITPLSSPASTPGNGSWFPGQDQLKSCGGSSSWFSSAAERLRGLVSDQQLDSDCFSNSGDWIDVR